MKEQLYSTLLFCSTLILTQIDCVEHPSNNTQNKSTVEISAVEIGCSNIDLLIRSTDGLYNKPVEIVQNDSMVSAFVILRDTVISRTGLHPNTSYVFKVKNSNSETVFSASTIDSTSHSISWMKPDTLSDFGVINDIWVFDKNNIWAVGEFLHADSNGFPSGRDMHNLAIWDGTNWKLKKLTVTFRSYQISPPLMGIHAYSSSDIWLSCFRPIHGDGTNWTIYDFKEILGYDSVSVTKMWGSSSDAMEFVGAKGKVANYSKGNWSWTPLWLSISLLDIWGISDKSIWAVGTDYHDGRAGIVYYDGTQWSSLYDNIMSGDIQHYPFSVWTNSSKKIYVAGADGVLSFSMATRAFSQVFKGNKHVLYSIRGTNINDVFTAGDGGEIYHFNGASWQQYNSSSFQSNGGAWLTKVFPTKDIVAVAGQYFRTFDYVPVIVRGYR